MQDTQICSYWLGYKLYRSDLYSIIFYKILRIIMMTWPDCSFSKDLILQFIIVEWWTNDRGGWPWPGGGNHWMIICNLSEEIICIVILIISLTNVSSPLLTISKDGRSGPFKRSSRSGRWWSLSPPYGEVALPAWSASELEIYQIIVLSQSSSPLLSAPGLLNISKQDSRGRKGPFPAGTAVY